MTGLGAPFDTCWIANVLLICQLQLLVEFRQLAVLGVVAGAVTCQGALEKGVLCHFPVVRELVVAKSRNVRQGFL